jgi:pyroglutamyl-peptidase
MKTILLTGFEPFGGDRTNPSEQIARALDGRVIAGQRVVGAVLPCVFGAANIEVRRLLRFHRPALVVAIGLAGNRAEITPERVAINVDDARIPDNAGKQPVDTPIVRGGPVAYWSTLPIKAVVAALRARNVPASVSQTAGTFVCNHVFYGLMHALRRRRGVRGGFIHVPAETALPLDTMIEAIALAIKVAATTRRDEKAGGGRDS